jgi:hypothetical protein
MQLKHKYIICREDLLQDPVTLFTEGLLIGRLKECELLLNHPFVSRAQAGIRNIDDNYYVFPLRRSNPVKLNGKPVEEIEALAAGDILEVAPFLLEMDETEDALVIRVSLQIGATYDNIDASSASLTTTKLEERQATAVKRPAKPRATPLPANKALDIFWDKRIREAGKMMRHSPLFPRSSRRTGKAQFNWSPTTDLGRKWPVSVFIWGGLIVGLASVAAAYWYTSAYAPGPIASVHASSQMSMVPPIAKQANGASCTSCHSFTGSMDKNCSSCHSTEAFVATVIKPHEDAGISCATCHAEHRGVEFKASTGALLSCTECHNDANKASYNGRRVATPHGGTFGYPVTNTKWVWQGISDSDWASKQIAIQRLPTENDEQWHSKQFHGLHVLRVKVVSPLTGNAQGQLSCSSCHKTFDPIDRETPRTTCGVCHNGLIDTNTNREVIARDKPNCTSCHVQHVKDKRQWGRELLAGR